jgi:hypothetical protein
MDPNKSALTDPAASYDEMSSVFDSLLGSTPKDEVTAEGDAPAATTPAEGEAKPDAATAPAGGIEEPKAEEPKAEEPKAEEPKAEEPKSEEDELRSRLDKLEQRTSEKAPPPETPPEDVRPATRQEPPESYNAEEKTFLADYEKEWPDVSRGEALKRRAEYQRVVEYVFSEIARVYGPLIERGASAADTVAETAALTAIRSAHNDYDDAMYESVVAWANDLPGYRKKVALGVIEEGEPQDVIDLISEFKTAKGLNKPKVVAGTDVPAKPAVTELPAAAKKAAQALGVVDSKRSAVAPNAEDPSDFDSAWAEAVGK